MPRSVKHALELDRINGNDLWAKAIQKEMTNVGIAFDIRDHGEKVPVGFEKVTGHIIFDVKMDFTRKARWVLDGHKCPKPDMSTYAGVVSRESVRIAQLTPLLMILMSLLRTFKMPIFRLHPQ